jgi:hypothetical protein
VLDLDDFDDHTYGLDIVFSIIHYKFHEIPDRPDIDQLHSIAKVTEKYDCAHLLIPYMEKWYVKCNLNPLVPFPLILVNQTRRRLSTLDFHAPAVRTH